MEQEKFINRLTNEWSSLAGLIKGVEADYPETMMLEVTNDCNLACIMCQNRVMKRPRRMMSDEIIDKALSEAAEIGIKRVALYTTGEPFLHPGIIKIIKKCKEKNFFTYMTSNGLLMNEKIIREFLEIGLDSIKISIDGADKKEYEKIRVKGNFDDLIVNLKLLKTIRDELKSDTKIYAGAVISKINDNSIKKFKETYGPYVDGIYLSPLVNQSGQIGRAYEKLKSEKIEVDTEWMPCKMLWDRVVISCEGKMVACCVDYENEMVYGDLNSDQIKEKWNSEKMKTWRRQHLNNELSDLKLCRTCNAPYIQQVEILERTNSLLND